MKNYLKRHKKTMILLFVYLLILVLVFNIARILMPDVNTATYGNRLNEIDKYPIDEKVYGDIEEEYNKNTNVKKVTHQVQGKIIKFFVTLDDKASIADAKKLGDTIIEKFDEKTLSYYSIEVYMLKDNKELNNFPIVGMKHPSSEKLVWTLDREITKEEEAETEGENNEG